MKSHRERGLEMFLPGRRVGNLYPNGGGTTWDPDDRWESEGQRPRLGADFLREPGPRSVGTGLLPWFENLIPEPGSVLRRRYCARLGIREGQAFALLAALGSDLPGAIEARRADGGGGQEMHLGEPEPTNSEPERFRMSSLTGMQLKFTMSLVGDRFSVAARAGATDYIVKLPGEHFTVLPEVEDTTMRWAKHAGFEVPPHRVVQLEQLDGLDETWLDKSTKAFAIRRFDRRDDGSKIHQEDLCQALGLPPGNKYGEKPSVDFEGALRLVNDLCGEETGREFARRFGFIIASGNTDAHLKNWSLLWGAATRPTLTPCYDLVSTVTWRDSFGWGRPDGARLALRFAGTDLLRLVDPRYLDEHARRSMLPWAKDEILTGIEGARAAWPEVEPAAPVMMRQAMDEHWRAVPLLASFGLVVH